MSYLGLYILINVFCIVLVLVFALHSRMGMGAMVAQRRFATAMYILVAFFASDTLWYAMDVGSLPQIWVASMALKTIYFLAATLAGYVWFLYMGSLTKAPFASTRTSVALASAIVWLHVALCAINLFVPILFSIGDDFVYARGPLFSVQYLFIYAYLVVASGHAIYQALRPENVIDRTRYIVISLFPLLPAASGILQLFWWRIPFNCMAFTLGVVIVYLTELGQQVSQEPLTQLSNRKQFMRALEQNINAHKTDGLLYLFMMDIDRFKLINDTYGHVEGDNAIVAVGEALKNAVSNLRKRAVLARYGGDEFSVIAQFDSQAEADQFKQVVKAEVARQSKLLNKDYDLVLSVGVARYSPEMASMRDFVSAADRALYEEKQGKR